MQKHSPLAWFSLTLVALMCVLPFLVPHHRNPLTTFYGEWMAAALGLMASTLLLRRSSWQPFHFPVVALVPIGLMVVLGVQVAAGLAVYWQQHFLVGLYLFWAALIVVLGAELRREFGLEKIVPVLAWAVLAGGLLSALIVALQITGKNLIPYIVPAKAAGYGANLMQINHLANYLGLALASLLYLVSTSRIKVGWAMLLAVALLFPLALTGQRMGWIYVVMLSVGGWLAGRQSGRWSWRILLLIPAFMVLQYVIPLFAISGAPAMPTQKVVAGIQGSSIRWELIQEAWHIFLNNPLIGAGFRSFGWQDFLIAETYAGHVGWYHHAHNLLLNSMAEMGLAGALVLLVGFVFWLKKTWVIKLSTERLWVYAILAVLGVHSLLEYPLWYAYFLGIFALSLGLLEEKLIAWRLDLGQILIAGVIVFGAFSLSNLGLHYTKLEAWYTRGIAGQIKGVEFDNMLEDMSYMRNRSLLTPYIDMIFVRVLPNETSYLEAKRVVNDQVMRFIPGEREVYSQVTLLMLNGQDTESVQQLNRAIVRHPRYVNKFAIELLKTGNPRMLPLISIVLRYNKSLAN